MTNRKVRISKCFFFAKWEDKYEEVAIEMFVNDNYFQLVVYTSVI